jgi:glycosyltransferase involved in cell wall biosynthesis
MLNIRRFGELLNRAKEIFSQRGLAGVLIESINYVTPNHFRIERFLYINKIKKVQNYKKSIDDGLPYNHHPDVSFLIQSFNQVNNVKHLARNIPQNKNFETIVLEDGSVDGTLEKWVEHSKNRNHIIIRTNDWHEIRTYSRAIDYARGDYIVLMQDDDTLPNHDVWIHRSIELLNSVPNLGLIGGYGPGGLDNYTNFTKLSHDNSIPPRSQWDRTADNTLIYPTANGRELNFVDPGTHIPIIYVPTVSVGPMIIDKKAYYNVGGFDLDFSQPGEPGIGFDGEFCLRLWTNGYKVVYSNMGFYGSKTGGTTLFQQKIRRRQGKRNQDLIVKKYETVFEEIQTLVCDSNAELISLGQGVEPRPLIDII